MFMGNVASSKLNEEKPVIPDHPKGLQLLEEEKKEISWLEK
jgi:hypothetical protein